MTRLRRNAALLVLVLIGLSIILTVMAAAAHAHDAAGWIMDDPETLWCCGRGDCDQAPEGAVRETGDGWQVVATGQIFPAKRLGTSWTENGKSFGLYVARRDGTWWCHPSWYGDLKRCLFVHPSGV